jgi:regulator of replication initiation timing
MLTEKINSLKIGHRADAEKKIDSLHRQVSDLEEELEALVACSSDRHCELKHIVNRLQYSSAKFRRS